MDPWLDINLIECLCGKCQRGGQCRSMRRLHQEDRAVKERRARLEALTDEDRAWLTKAGWDGQ
jgi:hypothetical protein